MSVFVCRWVCVGVCVCVFVMHGSVCAPHTEAHEWAIDEGVEGVVHAEVSTVLQLLYFRLCTVKCTGVRRLLRHDIYIYPYIFIHIYYIYIQSGYHR